MSETTIDRLRACELDASRVNADSPHRRELRRLLAANDLAAAAALLFVARVAELGHALEPGDIPAVVHEANELLEPFKGAAT